MMEPTVRSARSLSHATQRPSRAFRYDRGSECGSDLAPGRGSLLRSFGVWDRKAPARVVPQANPASVSERRLEDRLPVECHAWVGWKTWRRFQMNDALMIDLSRGGARVFLDAPPPTGRSIWVFIETPKLNSVVQARVLDVQSTRTGQCVARIAFDEPCPYGVFEAAVCGLAPVDPKRRLGRAHISVPSPDFKGGPFTAAD